MADDRKILIVLSAEGDDDEEKEQQSEEKEIKKAEKAQKQLITKALKSSIGEVVVQANYQLEKYLFLTEDYKTQTFVNNVKSTVDKVKNLGFQTYTFAKLGSIAGGPGGAAFGAILGAVLNVAHVAQDTYRQYQTQSLNLAMSDKQAFFAQSRLGLIDNGRGTQN